MTLTAPAAGSESVTYPSTLDSDGAWQIGRFAVSQPGNWTVRIDAVLAPHDHLVFNAPIAIEQEQ